MISQTAEYALRAIVFLADHQGEKFTAEQLSGATQVPARYLAKIMQQIVKADLVDSQRGPRGGFSMQRNPLEMTVLEVVQAVDPIHRIHECPLGIGDHGPNLCPTVC